MLTPAHIDLDALTRLITAWHSNSPSPQHFSAGALELARALEHEGEFCASRDFSLRPVIEREKRLFLCPVHGNVHTNVHGAALVEGTLRPQGRSAQEADKS